jgi:glycosyltransferase involved in cell wall biosynthesis
MKNLKEYRILYLINHSVPYGANKALINILDEVMPLGVKPFVIMAFDGAMRAELEKRDIEYRIIKHYFSIYPPLCSTRDVFLFFPRLFRIFWVNFCAEKKISKIVKEIKPDIIHTNIGPDHIGFYVAKKMKVPHVWHIREYQDLDFNMHTLFSKVGFIKKLQKSENYCIAITKGIFDYFFMTDKNARVIYDGVMKTNEVRFDTAKQKYFLFVGRLKEAKGIKNLLEAFVEFCINNVEFELLIAGDGELNYIKELQQIIDDAKIESRVRFLGFREDVCDLMSKATALVVPSRHEGFGFITVEAMFNGCLVIGNDSAGTREILEKENLGLLYTGHNELVATLKTVALNGIESYYPMMRQAQNRAIVLYSQEKNARLVYELYNEIIKHKT